MSAAEAAATVAGEWARRGLCRTSTLPPLTWSPKPSQTGLIADAKEVCGRCPVWDECGLAAIAQGDRSGIRAGFLLDTERDDLLACFGAVSDLCEECGDPIEDGRDDATMCLACGKGFVSARSSQAAITLLRDADWSLRKIGAAVGLNNGALLLIQRGEQRRVRAFTARRLEQLAETIEAVPA